jgi:ComEC/Rec2-related protein
VVIYERFHPSSNAKHEKEFHLLTHPFGKTFTARELQRNTDFVMPAKPLTTSLHHYPAVKLLVGCAVGMVLFSTVFFVPTAIVFGAALSCIFAGLVLIVILRKKTMPHGAMTKQLRMVTACVYWSAALTIGGMIGQEARSVRLSVSTAASALTLKQPAVLRGEVLRVVRRDSLQVRLLVRGILDMKAFPRLEETTMLLTVFTGKHDQVPWREHDSGIMKSIALRTEDLQSGTCIYVVVSALFPARAILPTDFDEERYAASLGASFLAQADVRNVAITEERRTVQHFFAMIAQKLEHRIDRLFPPETAPFALALLTGNTERLSLETKREYARTGTVHVLAVSGLHIGLLMAIILVPLAFVRHVALRWVLSVLGMTAFVLLTGAAPSAIRSAVMAALFLLAFATQRPARLLNVIALSVVLVLAWEPVLLTSPGFQMSAAAVLGIALTLPMFEQGFLRLLGVRAVIRRRDSPLRSALATALGVTVAASLAVAPIVAWYFGVVSFISPFANLAIVPLSSAAMIYTLASVVFSGFWGYGAELFAQTAHTCLLWMDALNHYAAEPRFAALEGRAAFVASLCLSASMLYCALAVSWRVLAFRAGVVCIAGALVALSLHIDTPLPQIQIIPREQVVAAVVSVNRHCILLLQDRRNSSLWGERPKADIGLERYIQEYCLLEQDSLTVCTTGAASMVIASRIGELLAKQNAYAQPHTIPQAPVRMRVIAQSLLYKDPRFFAALDTLSAKGILVCPASDLLKHSGIVRLAENALPKEQLGKSGSVGWESERCRLIVSIQEGSHAMQADSLILPKVTQYRTWSWER